MDDATAKAIGFGNPPTETRFRSGRSGNAKGRPRQSQSVKAIATRLFDAKIPVRIGEKTTSLPFLLALAHTLKAGALNGDAKMTRAFSRVMEALGYYNEEPKSETRGVLVVSGIRPNEDEWLWAVALDRMRREKKRMSAVT